MFRIGVDTGGTFTDFVFYRDGRFSILKIPSTPEDPSKAVLRGLEQVKEDFILIHGTTVATNAFLEGKTPPTAFVTTEGFQHLLHIGRQNRINLFSLFPEKPPSIVPLNLCFGLNERVLADGTVERKLEAEEVIELAQRLKEKGIKSVAVTFLHSYRNPCNEKLAAELLRKEGYFVSASFEIMPEYREYERAVLTVLNASLMPVMHGYIERLEKKLKGRKFFIMQSSGGFLSPALAASQPVKTILSGPAGGAIAAWMMGSLTGHTRLITLDMGGTSTDVSLIDSGIKITKEASLAHLPLRIPMIDIQTVGAGGGSIAKVDPGGALRVGPESAGARPGPACYGYSELATVTDAFVVLGLLVPDLFLGGKMEIFPERSFKVIGKLAEEMGKDVKEAAWGVIEVALSSMERALRAVSIERGHDPRQFVLFPFGGAGGLVAAELAPRLGIKRVVVPNYQGVFSALGMVFADSVKELSSSFMKEASPSIASELEKGFRQLEAEAQTMLEQEGFGKEDMIFLRSLDMRYRGQSFEINVPYGPEYLEEFHRLHQRLYSHHYRNRPVEVVNLRLRAVGKVKGISLKPCAEGPSSPAQAFYREVQVYYRGQQMKVPVFKREALKAGMRMEGPAIVAAVDSTVFIPPKFSARVDSYLNLIIDENV